MIGRWWAEASKYQVLAIDGSIFLIVIMECPSIARPMVKFVYKPGGL